MDNDMKKILFALAGAALLLAGCVKEKSYYIEQNPNRMIVEYTPSTFTMEVPGTLTADADYNWITMSQSGNTATFTVRRNTTGVIREADYTISGQSLKAKIFQRAHSLDAAVTAKLTGQGLGTADIKMSFTSDFPDDYASWGIIYSTDNNVENGKDVPQSGVPVLGENEGHISGLAENTDYIIWTYVVSTEGERIVSSPVGLVPPVFVMAGEDLQAAIDNAKEFSEIRVQGGAVFGSIHFYDIDKNKTLSGGWNADFTEQSWDNLSVIDAGGKDRGIYVAKDAVDTPIEGYVEVSYFEIRNSFCAGGHGSAVRISGGPVTIHHCWIHHNEADRGTIATREDNESSDLTVYDCVITHNVTNGHAAAISIEDGQSRANPTKAVIVGNIMANNRSIKYDGYAGVVYLYQSVDVQFLNNTMVNNFNYYLNGGGWYPDFYIRYNTCATVANNLLLRAWCAKSEDGAEPWIDEWPIEGNGSRVTFHNNYLEGKVWALNGDNQNYKELSVGMDLKTLLKNPDGEMVKDLKNKDAQFTYMNLTDFLGSNYMPVGEAVGAGTLSALEYASYDTANLGVIRTCDVKGVLNKFGEDINGRPFVNGGKVSIGALAAE